MSYVFITKYESSLDLYKNRFLDFKLWQVFNVEIIFQQTLFLYE